MVERALKQSPASGIVMFVSACSYSLSSESVQRDASLSQAVRLELRKRYQAKTNQLLRQAYHIGLFDDTIYRDQMTTFSDFEPMRGDVEFDQFCTRLRQSSKALP